MSPRVLLRPAHLAGWALAALAASPASFAQCANQDAYEPNDTCAAAQAMHTFATTGLTVTATDPDFYWIDVPAGNPCTVSVLFSHAAGDIDVVVFANCSPVSIAVDSSTTTTNNEFVSWTNTTGSTARYYVRITNNTGSVCTPYSFVATISVCPANDRFENQNDGCANIFPSTPTLVPGTYNALVSKALDNDYFRLSVPAGATAEVDAWFKHGGTNGDVDIIVDDGCPGALVVSSISVTDNESVRWTNLTGADRTYILLVRQAFNTPSTLCANYSITYRLLCDEEDDYEDNDTCATATNVSASSFHANRLVTKTDEDWYRVDVPNSATLRVTATFLQADADVDILLYDACGGLIVANSTTVTNNELLAWNNATGALALAALQVYVWQESTGECAPYDLRFEILGGTSQNLVPFCFGDGSGVNCPCGNNSPVNHPGGCAHQNGSGAILYAIGSPSASLGGGPHFDIVSAAVNSFCVLVSGDNALPQNGACIGCGIPSFDGLRCVGGDFQRHGARALNGLGSTVSGWGPPSNPVAGIAQQFGFVPGQTRHFSGFFRVDPLQTCHTGQNSSNAVSVTFGP